MKCAIVGCSGEVIINNPVQLSYEQVGSNGFGFPCNTCGALHWRSDGSLIRNEGGEVAFLEEGQVVFKPSQPQPA